MIPGASAAHLERTVDLLNPEGSANASVPAVQSRLDPSAPVDSPVVPDEIQYMPPGRHQIHAHQGGEGVTLEVEVTSETAAQLGRSLQAALAEVKAGRGDRPYFDFNHEDREAAGWPLAFRWAGDDVQSGGVRARVDWSDAGRRAIEGRTFRRFSPSFFVQDSQVTGAPVNMGGLVNRAAFRTIQPLFARSAETESAPIMSKLIESLHELGLVQAVSSDETGVAEQVRASLSKLRAECDAATGRVAELEAEKTAAVRARAVTHVEAAVRAGRIQPADTQVREFWLGALIADEARALHALAAVSAHAVLTPVVPAEDAKSQPRDLMAAQQRKLDEVRAAHPEADFATIFAKAQADAPELFR